ncbi:sensor histidine kinase [Hydrogenimonas sp.]
MRRKEIFKVLIFYVVSFMAMGAVVWLVFENFGYTRENFFVVTMVLFPLLIFFGYLLSKIALEPLFVTNDLLDRLLKDTLHELNIPLSTIFANVSMLSRFENDRKKLKRLSRIEKAGGHLLELYEDLDYFIKKEIGSVEKERFELREVVEKSVRKMEDIRGDISIQYRSFDMSVIADRRGCQKAIDNLLSNAIKYNRPGGSVKIFEEKGSLVVQDSGIGMDDQTLFRVFDRYYQSELSASGYGIGLHIVKTFCDQHGIKIKIESKVNSGTTFRLDFKGVKA